MREIKFRVFDRLTNKMIEVTKLEWGPHQLSEFVGRTGDSGNSYNVHKGYFNEKGYFNGKEIRSKRYVLMQYTGLKDENGIEIYEGDFVETLDGIGKVIYEDFLCTFAIEYKVSKIAFIHYITQENASLEVIGNIYENPELLDDKQ